MAGVRGVIAGVLGLSLMEAIVSSSAGSANTAGIIGFASRGLARWLNPYTPLIPNLAPNSYSVSTPIPGLTITGSSATKPAPAAPAAPQPV